MLDALSKNSNVCTFLGIAICCALGGPVSASGVRMNAELRPSKIYLGTQTLLTVEVVNAGTQTWPIVEPVEGLQITPYRSPSLTHDLFRGTSSYVFSFLVTPGRKGVFQIPSVSWQSGDINLKKGPFELQVLEAPLNFREAKIEPTNVLVEETAELVVSYQGVRPGTKPVVPEIPGLSIRSAGEPQVQVTRREGIPITFYTFQIKASKLGTYRISGISLDKVPADPVILTVSPFVIVRTQVGENSLVVGGQTVLHVLIKGLPETTKIKIVAPVTLKSTPAKEQYRGPAGISVFSFDVAPSEPGTFSISQIELPDGQKVALPEPVTLSVRQSGQAGILVCRGSARSDQTVIGEPFHVDFEVFFRGDLQAAGLDTSQASFARKEYVKVEPVNDPIYPDWRGQPLKVQYDDGWMVMLSGSGKLNGKKEQLLRFTLKITPFAAGELSLDGVKVILALQIKEEQKTRFSFFSSTETRNFERMAEVPPHQVIDPPGITQPPGYRGAVGTYEFRTELDRNTATAMSPLTLTMKISGEGIGPQFTPPPLTELAELKRDFDVSPTVNGGEIESNTITFTQTIRPKSDSVTEVPALPLVFYDYKKKKYDTVYSLPIPLEVTPGSLVGAGAMKVAVGTESPPPDEADKENGDKLQVSLGANYPTLGDLVAAEPLGAAHILVLLGSGPVCLILVMLAQHLYIRCRPGAQLRQQRRKLRASLGDLDRSENFCADLSDILHAFLRLSFNLPPGEISVDILESAFNERSLDDGLLREAQDISAQCDAGRFADDSVTDEDKHRLINRTRQLFINLERNAK